jgi:hypothetical protein
MPRDGVGASANQLKRASQALHLFTSGAVPLAARSERYRPRSTSCATGSNHFAESGAREALHATNG